MKRLKQICFSVLFINFSIFGHSQRLVIEGYSKFVEPNTAVSISIIRPSNLGFSFSDESFDTKVDDKNCFILNTNIETANLCRLNITKSDGRKYSAMLFLDPKKCHFNIRDSFLKEIQVTGSKSFFEFENFSKQIYDDSATTAFRDSLNSAIATNRSHDPTIRSRLDSLLDLRTKAWTKISLKWIKENENSRINSYVAYMNLLDKGYEEDLKAVFHDLKRTKENCWDEELNYYLSNLTVGDIVPTWNLFDTSGKRISLLNFRGKYVLLDFWAAWCVPCRKNNPFLNTVYERFKSKPFEIVGVSLDEKKDAWTKAIQADNMQWIQVADLKGWEESAVARQYMIKVIPSNYLLDMDGKIVAKNIQSDQLIDILTSLFKIN